MTQKDLKKVLTKSQKLMGISIDVEKLAEEWGETQESKMLEAQSVLNYFDSKGKGWEYVKCKECEETFAYSYHYKGITRCSISCMKRALAKQGIKWNPDRDIKQRWGRYHPAIVQKSVLDLFREFSFVGQQLDLLEYLEQLE